MKIKKILSIVFINTLLLFFFIYAIELYLYNSIWNVKPFKFPNYSLESYVITAENERNFFNENFKKKPIWLMGCSYAWGYLLDKKDSFGAKISKLTKRPVYNWASCGIGPAEALIRLFTNKNDKYLPKTPPEMVIYIYMYNHLSRRPCDYNTLYALKKFGVLQNKNGILDNLYFVKAIKQELFNKDFDESITFKKEEFMKKMFIEMKKQVNKRYPSTKFVILIYNDSNKDFKDGHVPMCDFEYELLNLKEYWQQYKDEGFIVITTKELIGREMNRAEDRIQGDKADTPHPTTQIWDIVIPKLIKKLNL